MGHPAFVAGEVSWSNLFETTLSKLSPVGTAESSLGRSPGLIGNNEQSRRDG